ncbi:RasGEF domain containing protein [Acanthamoeba castellanii str. Neff]|uniref:RasGEF domain containing protein n=1 Tax=Acanthamoeba castellanii (strain ATCC 30010 / Neff) TaxID=1257118 RepID=L8HKN6_ACACF|nr:RasGEF domain containing protein [Acanthamoeba castellanii str. Neff]ELR24956.1 RasGEF domain containing protein [Acanthamoeba castellanii str. Neff]
MKKSLSSKTLPSVSPGKTPSHRSKGEKEDDTWSRLHASTPNVKLARRVSQSVLDDTPHYRYDYFRDDDSLSDEDDEDSVSESDDADDAVVCEVVSDDEGGHHQHHQAQSPPDAAAAPEEATTTPGGLADELKAIGDRPRFTIGKRTVSGLLDNKRVLGQQRTKAVAAAAPTATGSGAAATEADAGEAKAADEGSSSGAHQPQAEEQEDSDDDEESATEHTEDTNETDDVNTEDYEPDLSDDDKELHHNFSDGCLTAGDDLAHAGVNYSLRARRGVVLDTPEGIVGVGYGLGEGVKSSKNGGGGGGSPLGGSKALKLLGIQERSDAAMDRFNSATPLGPLDVIDGGKKKLATRRGSKIKLPSRGSAEKVKIRSRSKNTPTLSSRSQSDTTLDVIERGEVASRLGKSSPKVPKQRSSIKHMRASIKSQFSDSVPPGPEVVPARKVVGTIDELIALLFDAQHCESDKDYESDFLYLYRFFIKPKTLLKKFIELYRKKEALPDKASAERIAEGENERYRTKKRIIELIQSWTKLGFDDLNEDANFMQKLTFFINNVLTPNERTESNINIELTQLIERKNAVYKKQVGPNLLRSKEEEELAKARFIPLKPDQCHRVVEEMTFIERSLFVAIQPWEFLAVLWNSSPPTPEEMKRQQNYNMWEEHKTRLENWVASEILTRPDLTERTLTLKKFIDIARFAYKNGNLNCVHTIVTALSSPALKRLAKTWSNLPSKSVASFDKLVARVLSGEQTDYQAYTSLLKEGRTLSFLLPSLSVFAREISRLKEAKKEDESGDKAKTVVDFTMLRRATVVMQEIQGYQQRGSPALTSRPILNKFLRQQHRSLPDNVIYYFSLHCESEEDGTSKEIQIDSLDPGLVYAINAGRFFVKSGSPTALAAKVLDKWLSSLDPDFRDAVILCRAYWLPSVDLFNKLTECYPKEAPTDMWGDYKEAEVHLPDIQERLRTVDAIRFWMEVEMHELANDDKFKRQLTEFVDNTYFINSNEASFFLHLKQTFNPVRPPVPSSVAPVVSGVSEEAVTVEYPIEEKLMAKTFPRELAECLTIIDQVMLKAIPPKELVRKAYTKPEKSPNMAGMVNHFNSISNWAASLIVLETNQQRRAQLLVQFILAAWECRLIHNFNGSYAIVAALNNAAISRLKQTWALVPARALGRWKELEFLFDFPGAFRNYREAIAKTKPPVIPFLANYSKNLFGIEENNLVYIADGVVNFERFVMLVSQIRDLQTYQQYSYNFTVDPALYDYLVEGKNKIILSEDDCYEHSQDREGRQAACNSDGDMSPVLSSSTSSSSSSGSSSLSSRSMSSPALRTNVGAASPPPSSSGAGGPSSAPAHLSALASVSSSSSPPSPSSPLDSSPPSPSSPLTRSSTVSVATRSSSLSSSPSRSSVGLASSPLFGRSALKLGRSSSSLSVNGGAGDEADQSAVKRNNPIFGARLPSSPSPTGSPSPLKKSAG